MVYSLDSMENADDLLAEFLDGDANQQVCSGKARGFFLIVGVGFSSSVNPHFVRL